MKARRITETQLRSFHNYLIREEKNTATVEKYLRDVRAFVVFVGGNAVTKELVMTFNYFRVSPIKVHRCLLST